MNFQLQALIGPVVPPSAADGSGGDGPTRRAANAGRPVALGVAFALAFAAAAHAAPTARPVEWTVGPDTFSGYLVYDAGETGRRPGLVMVPNWMGVTDSAVEKAKRIAGDDYVVLVADMYGKGVRPANPQQAQAQVTRLYSEPATLRARIDAAVATLRHHTEAPVRPDRIGALGFCFGGSTVLELARSGADLAGVASLHGGLGPKLSPAAPGAVKAPILVLNGAADTSVTAEDIAAFQQEMDAAGADWQFVNFSGAVHCFAEPEANSPPGCAYDERSAKRAYRMLDDFFEEAFKD